MQRKKPFGMNGTQNRGITVLSDGIPLGAKRRSQAPISPKQELTKLLPPVSHAIESNFISADRSKLKKIDYSKPK